MKLKPPITNQPSKLKMPVTHVTLLTVWTSLTIGINQYFLLAIFFYTLFLLSLNNSRIHKSWLLVTYIGLPDVQDPHWPSCYRTESYLLKRGHRNRSLVVFNLLHKISLFLSFLILLRGLRLPFPNPLNPVKEIPRLKH